MAGGADGRTIDEVVREVDTRDLAKSAGQARQAAPAEGTASVRPYPRPGNIAGHDRGAGVFSACPACQDGGMTDPRAGQPAAAEDLVDVAKLVTAYYALHPDPAMPRSGCRSAPQVIAGRRSRRRSTRTTSSPSPRRSASTGPGTGSTARCTWASTPTRCPSPPRSARSRCSRPTASGCCSTRAAGTRRPRRCRGRSWPTTRPGAGPRADGIVITPSHNPPSDGGFKYNPPDGGPAGTEITRQIQDRANELLADGLNGVRRIPYARAVAAETTGQVRLPRRLRVGAGPGGGLGRDQGGRGADRRRPARRGERRPTGARSPTGTAWT